MRPSRAELLGSLGLLLVGGAVAVGAEGLLSLPDHAGSDPDLWGLSAVNLERGAPSLVPPLFPWLVATVGTPSPHLVDVAARVSEVAAGLVPVGVFVLARRLGAPVLAAALAGLLALADPHVLGFATQVQPDALFALALPLVVALALGWWRRPESRGAQAGLLLLVAAVPLMREQGLVLAGLLGLLLVAAPGTLADRGLRGLAALSALVLGPALLGLAPGLPWDQPWFARLAMAGEVFEAGEASQRLPAEASGALREAYERSDQLAIVGLHALRALGSAPVLWLGLFAALGLALRRRWWVAMVGLLPALPALVIFSEPRHVAVVWPVVAAVFAAAGAGGGRRRLVWLLGGVLALAGVATGSLEHVGRLRFQAEDMASLRTFGAELCDKAEPGDLGAGEPRAFTFCPLPVVAPGLAAPRGADWRTWFASDSDGPPGWSAEGMDSRRFVVFRLEPDRTSGRPCAASRPPAEAPVLTLQPRQLELLPPCSGDLLDARAAEADPHDRPRVKPRGRHGRQE